MFQKLNYKDNFTQHNYSSVQRRISLYKMIHIETGGYFIVFQKLNYKDNFTQHNYSTVQKKISLYKMIHIETGIMSLSSANKYKVRQSNISVLFGADILF